MLTLFMADSPVTRFEEAQACDTERYGALFRHLLAQGVYVIAFSFPVVPRGKARIRVQLSAAHSEADVRRCVEAFVAARESTT